MVTFIFFLESVETSMSAVVANGANCTAGAGGREGRGFLSRNYFSRK